MPDGNLLIGCNTEEQMKQAKTLSSVGVTVRVPKHSKQEFGPKCRLRNARRDREHEYRKCGVGVRPKCCNCGENNSVA